MRRGSRGRVRLPYVTHVSYVMHVLHVLYVMYVATVRRSLPIVAALCTVGCASLDEPWRIERSSVLDAYLETPRSAKPVLVVDIDDTLVHGGFPGSLRLALNFFYSWKPPFTGAPEALAELQRDWNVVLLTARDDFFAARTLRWLDARGFPETPVIFSKRLLPSSRSKVDYKSRTVARLRELGLRPGYGVGDKWTDVRAYVDNGLEAVLILDGPHDPDLGRTLEALGIERWPPDDATPSPGLILLAPAESWGTIREHLRDGKNATDAKNAKNSKNG